MKNIYIQYILIFIEGDGAGAILMILMWQLYFYSAKTMSETH